MLPCRAAGLNFGNRDAHHALLRQVRLQMPNVASRRRAASAVLAPENVQNRYHAACRGLFPLRRSEQEILEPERCSLFAKSAYMQCSNSDSYSITSIGGLGGHNSPTM
jgi:hypothetical protein